MTLASHRVALVTGAAQRVGRAIALELGRQGWAVAVHYHSSRVEAMAVCSELERSGATAVALAADLYREEEVVTLIDRAAEALGPVTCLINNAATFEPDSAASATRSSWDIHIETNLRAPFVLIQRLAHGLPAGVQGNVVNLLDQRVWNLTPFFVSYTVSKAALWTLTQTMALALAPRIRVNAIGPGPTLRHPRQSEQDFARHRASTPLGRGTTVEEICAALSLILASPSMTGQMIALDGGQHLGWAHRPPPESG